MEIQITDASSIVDKFEDLMSRKGVSVPLHPETGADMMPFWHLLKRTAQGFSGTADELRPEFTAAVAVHDLAAKVLEVSTNPHFDCLLPHLKLLNSGAIHLTEEPPSKADVYNKLIEMYWSCLCLSLGRKVELDGPTHSTGDNPDVIVLDEAGNRARAYAFKTIRSPHTQSVYEHISKGIDQIERSPAMEGIVALHLTPRVAKAGYWPTGGYYQDWRPVAWAITQELTKTVASVVGDNGQPAIDPLFKGKKAVGAILCLAFCPIVAKHPVTGKAIVMPLKVATLVDLYTGRRMSTELLTELTLANHMMQTVLL
jgi:hypothetical protein